MNGTDRRALLIASALGVIPVGWVALLAAPYADGGLLGVLPHMDKILTDPFHITLVEDSGKFLLVFLLMYVMGVGIWLSTRRNYRRGEEHGSARWGDAGSVNKKYAARPYRDNKLLTQNVRIGYDGRKHRRNLNTLVIGGSGSGKTRFFCKPNIMQANTSLVILDPKGETNYSHFFITFFQRREMQ